MADSNGGPLKQGASARLDSMGPDECRRITHVSVRGPKYRGISHLHHTWRPSPHQTACFQPAGSGTRVGSIPVARSTLRLASGRV
jgi:hypothetical protein